MKLPTHLGGHANITHIDSEAFNFLYHYFEIKSMVDVGCGVGGMVDFVISKGIKAIGVDGDFTIKRKIPFILNDYTKSSPVIPLSFDMAWSVEFLEHVEEKYLPNIFDTFKKCKVVFCTANPLVGHSHHHVNCQPIDYWIELFASYGFTYLKEETTIIRSMSSMKRDFVRKTGMIFKNDKSNK